jgi:hypothetical protein
MRPIPGYPRRERPHPTSPGWWLVIDRDDDVPWIVGIEDVEPKGHNLLPFGNQ